MNKSFLTFIIALMATAATASTISLGEPSRSSSGELIIPVLLDAAEAPDVLAWAISVRAEEQFAGAITIEHASNAPVIPAFEATARGKNNVTYIAWSPQQSMPDGVMHIADVHVSAAAAVRADFQLELDRALTTVCDSGGMHPRTEANGGLRFENRGIGGRTRDE